MVVREVLGRLRLELARRFELTKPEGLSFCWVTEFPMVEYDPEAKRWQAMHHPFTSPRPEDLELLESDPGKAKARAYDLVLNGTEVGGGSIRIHTSGMCSARFSRLCPSPMRRPRRSSGFYLKP